MHASYDEAPFGALRRMQKALFAMPALHAN